MRINRVSIEKIKNVALVVLVCSTILLLYFLWNNNPQVSFNLPTLGEAMEPIPIRDILNPERITANFGGENYTVLSATTGIWDNAAANQPDFLRAINSLTNNRMVSVSTISRTDYNTVMRSRSIQADFAFPVPLSEYSAEYALPQLERLDMIENFTTIGYSEASPESIFVCDRNAEKYYRLAVQGSDTAFDDLISHIESMSNASYYPLRTYSGVENDVMIPLDMKIYMADTQYRSYVYDNDLEDENRITGMAKQYFGETFDFTRKVTEGSGNLTYMYGFGEKVLSIKKDGTFEYSAATDSAGGSSYFFAALKTALDFLAKHAEVSADNSARNMIYLKDVEPATDGKSGYRFHFGLEKDGYRIDYENSEPYVIEVAAGKVVYSKFDMIVCDPGAANGSKSTAYMPFDLMVENYQYVYDILSRENVLFREIEEQPPMALTDDFSRVVGLVTGVDVGYLRLKNDKGSGILAPVWIVNLQGVDIYFDLYSGKPVAYKA